MTMDEGQLRRALHGPTTPRMLYCLMMLALFVPATWSPAAVDAVAQLQPGGVIRGFASESSRASLPESAGEKRLPVLSRAGVFTTNLGWHLFLYFTTAGAAYLVFHVLGRRALTARQIQPRAPASAAIRRDILYSLSSAIVFALVALLTRELFVRGWTKLYLDINRYGRTYFWFSLAAMIGLHDTWFYWTHRLMHWPRLFALMHRVHHLSHTPTPWSALAFHPTEAVVQALVFPLAALLLPLHPFVALLWLIYMFVINVWGHLGFELLPAGFGGIGCCAGTIRRRTTICTTST